MLTNSSYEESAAAHQAFRASQSHEESLNLLGRSSFTEQNSSANLYLQMGSRLSAQAMGVGALDGSQKDLLHSPISTIFERGTSQQAQTEALDFDEWLMDCSDEEEQSTPKSVSDAREHTRLKHYIQHRQAVQAVTNGQNL